MEKLIKQIELEKFKQRLSNEDFAKATGKDRSSIRRYFNGDAPPLDVFIKMAKVVNLKIYLK